ncbi:hypothetical protein UA08_00042 [Talaromyces atroroseus]|uniref:Uncharacterized protein n=1 Tax=Talaromyces atroroseus TaxID=1441469 RepID=A0A225AW10_TALAT|nr:hypothetical protein UA08_00042 [Talaromyces atroroseus]OKL63803.1 hypothetical protein UA08_00042 [Talaromyces atroroseus]
MMKTSQLIFSQLRCLAGPSAARQRAFHRRSLAKRLGLRYSSTTKKPSPSKINVIPKKSKLVAVKPVSKYTAAQPWKPTVQRAAPENVLIYHAGTGRVVFLGMLRTATIFVCGVSTMIIAPAFFADEFAWYIAPLIVIGGALPLAFVSYTTAPFVNNIYLHLPIFARKSRETALEYVRNLPPSAEVSIRTMKITTIPRTTQIFYSYHFLENKSSGSSLVHTATNSNSSIQYLHPFPTTFIFSIIKSEEMAGKDTKEKADASSGLPNLTQAELKLIALGAKFTIGGAGKVDYEQIAKYGGYTKGSAQVMYRKVLRKLTDSLDASGVNNADGGDAAMLGSSETPATPAAKTPKTPRSRKSNKRTKGTTEEVDPGDEASPMVHTPSAPDADAMNTFLTGAGALDGSDTEPTPSKRQRKSPIKKTPAKSSAGTSKTFGSLLSDMPLVKDEEDAETSIKSEE